MNKDISRFTEHDQMVEIPNGEIELRDDRTKQKWFVNIKPFLLSKFPVTQNFYFDVIKENPSTVKGDKHPVETVSWKDAVIFCNELSIKTGLYPCYSMTEKEEEIAFD